MIETDNPLSEVATGEASPEAVLRLARWLRANPDGWVRLYHDTAAHVPVENQGLLPTSTRRRNSLQSRSGYFSFSIFPGHAEMFALLAFPRRSVTVYGVDLRVGERVPDLDQLRNQRAWAERCVKPTLAHSLAYGHSAQVKGAVSAARLPEPHREICVHIGPAVGLGDGHRETLESERREFLRLRVTARRASHCERAPCEPASCALRLALPPFAAASSRNFLRRSGCIRCASSMIGTSIFLARCTRKASCTRRRSPWWSRPLNSIWEGRAEDAERVVVSVERAVDQLTELKARWRRPHSGRASGHQNGHQMVKTGSRIVLTNSAWLPLKPA